MRHWLENQLFISNAELKTGTQSKFLCYILWSDNTAVIDLSMKTITCGWRGIW